MSVSCDWSFSWCLNESHKLWNPTSTQVLHVLIRSWSRVVSVSEFKWEPSGGGHRSCSSVDQRQTERLLQVNGLCSSSLIVLWLGAGPVCVNPSPSWSDLTAAQVKAAPDWLSNECILHLIGLKAFTNFTGYSFCRHGRESYKIRVKTLNCARAAFFKSDRLNVKWFDGSHREVKPKHLDGPLVAGCSIGHKPLLLHVSRWDMD